MVVLTTSLVIDSLLLLTALQLHVCRMTYRLSFRLTDRLTKTQEIAHFICTHTMMQSYVNIHHDIKIDQ